MKTSSKKTDYGTIYYRFPNAIETMEFYYETGLITGEADYASVGRMFLRDELHKYVQKVDLQIGGEKISTFEGALEHVEMLKPLLELVNEIILKLSASMTGEVEGNRKVEGATSKPSTKPKEKKPTKAAAVTKKRGPGRPKKSQKLPQL